MTREQLQDALLGLFAYDHGATDSGIHDEGLRDRCKQAMKELADNDFRLTMSWIVRESFLTDDALAHRYGIEDVAEFLRWLADWMDVDL